MSQELEETELRYVPPTNNLLRTVIGGGVSEMQTSETATATPSGSLALGRDLAVYEKVKLWAAKAHHCRFWYLPSSATHLPQASGILRAGYYRAEFQARMLAQPYDTLLALLGSTPRSLATTSMRELVS